MPEEGFSFFKIQNPPGKFNPPQTKMFTPKSCKFWHPLYFSLPKMAKPPPSLRGVLAMT